MVRDAKRRLTREVMVGRVGIGGDNPIRIQSMTASNTRDVTATVEQIIKLADCGCEIARLTVPGIKEAEACEKIKNRLLSKGYTIPLVADIHFYPPAAMIVAEFADKIRINPGNFADKRATFQTLSHNVETYREELKRIEEKLLPLIEKCKKLQRAMRIGVNHGSLSDRIMSRWGNTPRGMTESAIEFGAICRQYGYHDLVFSMKSSNPKIMIDAYRLLADRMESLGWDYPFHLGVTEAGEGDEGRIKSAMGIGPLLMEGLGDTVRISLTEDPWHEIDPCRRLLQFVAGTALSSVDKDCPHNRPLNFPQPLFGKNRAIVGISSGGQDFIITENNEKILLKPRRLSEAEEGEEAVIVEKENWDILKKISPSLIVLRAGKKERLPLCRRFFRWQRENNQRQAVFLNFTYDCSREDLLLRAAAEYGALFCDGLGEGIWLQGPYDDSFLISTGFAILQAARMRSVKTEFISCPGCGRTLFDIQKVVRKIKNRAGHLPGVKIAVMGCIVNGPGEMADADFGYVGSKAGKVDLYVGKERVERNIEADKAEFRLIELIKKHGRWQDG